MIRFIERYELYIVGCIAFALCIFSFMNDSAIEHTYEYFYLPAFSIYAALRTKRDVESGDAHTTRNAIVRWGVLVVIFIFPFVR